MSALSRTPGLVPAPRRLSVPLSLWVSPGAFAKFAPVPLTAPALHIPKSTSDKSLIAIPPPSIAGKRLATFSSALHPCQSVVSSTHLLLIKTCFLHLAFLLVASPILNNHIRYRI